MLQNNSVNNPTIVFTSATRSKEVSKYVEKEHMVVAPKTLLLPESEGRVQEIEQELAEESPT